MDNFFYLAVGLLAMAIVFTLVLAYRLYQDQKQKDLDLNNQLAGLIQSNKQTANEGLIEELREELDLLRSDLKKIHSQKETSTQTLTVLTALLKKIEDAQQPASPRESERYSAQNGDDHSVFSHAIRLAKEKMSPEKIVEICGIELSEAEIIVKIHGPVEAH
jgi:LPS O-antigen subunit length determinant protein (WzzB/FepE family)